MNNKNALIIDSNEKHRNELISVLRILGYNTKIASNGAKAITMCRKNNFDIHIIDKHMPDVTSSEFIKRLMKINKRPLIYIMCKTHDINAVSSKIHGLLVKYIIKPFVVFNF